MYASKKDNDSKLLFYYGKFMILIGIAGQCLFYLQAYKINQEGCAHNVSFEGFIIAFLSLICWLVYGILIKDKVLIIVNAFAALGASLTIAAIFYVS